MVVYLSWELNTLFFLEIAAVCRFPQILVQKQTTRAGPHLQLLLSRCLHDTESNETGTLICGS